MYWVAGVIFQRVDDIDAGGMLSDPIAASGERALQVFNLFPKLARTVQQRGGSGMKEIHAHATQSDISLTSNSLKKWLIFASIMKGFFLLRLCNTVYILDHIYVKCTILKSNKWLPCSTDSSLEWTLLKQLPAMAVGLYSSCKACYAGEQWTQRFLHS